MSKEKVILFRYVMEELEKQGNLTEGFSINDAVDQFEKEEADFFITIVETSSNHYQVFSGKYPRIQGEYTIDEGGHVVVCLPIKNREGEDR